MKKLAYFLFFYSLVVIFSGQLYADEKKAVTVCWNDISDGMISYNLNEEVMRGEKCKAFTESSPNKTTLAELFLRVKGIIRVCICPKFNVTVTKGEAFRLELINSRAKIIFGEYFPGATIKFLNKAQCKDERS